MNILHLVYTDYTIQVPISMYNTDLIYTNYTFDKDQNRVYSRYIINKIVFNTNYNNNNLLQDNWIKFKITPQ